ncbi:MAG: GNAT family acetyltransferase [Alphaproteobacteria bacterium]|jgi:ribosomal protein S18 acetylase RimI-like enzyme|nr:GNAT family acetyltransferase [Alphaproteobacteria bacterium]
MKIRPFADGDEAPVVALWEAAGLLVNPLNDARRDIAFCRDSGHGEVMVGEAEGRIVATVMVGHDGHRGWVYYLATEPASRERGMGRQMMQAAEDWLTKRGVQKVELIVRDTNTAVIGFYQRLGYAAEPRAILAKRLDGIAVAAGGQMSDQEVVITYLEMTERPSLPHIESTARKLALLRSESPTVSFYHYLYDAVGREWFWTDRKKLDDETLKGIIQDPLVDVFVLYVDGAPAGYFELDRRAMPTIDLAYFGIMPEFIGLRLGPYLLGQAIEAAWRHDPARLTVNTCTLDHPKALPLYQRFGFRPYDQQHLPAPWQRGDDVAYDV